MNPDNTTSRPNKWEYIIPALAIASLLISSIVVSSKKYFWNDELFSYYFLADHSFTHMMRAFHDALNNTPPLYFVIGWLWARAFGSTELSLRLFSSLGMCVACLTVWMTLRRTYNVWSVSVGTLSVFCTCTLILSQNAEARMYGLFMAVCALALHQYDISNTVEKSSWRMTAGTAAIHCAIVQTHLFGLFYSGAILFAQMVRDRYLNVIRPKIYLSIVLSWLTLILYLPAFLHQADAGNPRAWIPIPSLKQLDDFVTVSSPPLLGYLVIVLALSSAWQFLGSKSDAPYSQTANQTPRNANAEISFLIFALSYLAVPIVVWIISRSVKPLFWDRFMIPTTLGWSILLTYFVERVLSTSLPDYRTWRISKIRFLALSTSASLVLASIAFAVIKPIRYAENTPREDLPGSNHRKFGHGDLPIVVQYGRDFHPLLYYSPDRWRYFYILDWQSAVDDASGLFPPQEYKHMEAWKREYPELFRNNILQSEEFLARYDEFLVLDYLQYDKRCPMNRRIEDMNCPRWLEMRIMSNPHYKISPLGEVDGFKMMLLVEKTLGR